MSEHGLRRGRVLCSCAGSVFAMSAAGDTDIRRLAQARSQTREMVWTRRAPAKFDIDTRDDGLSAGRAEKQ
jgi:hypothetical protein